MKNILNKLFERAEDLGWNVNVNENDVDFSWYSPAGQDFYINIAIEDTEDELEAAELFIHSIYRQYIDYNPSEETYYWLDSTGHGKNGAPYEMIEVYNDMVECENMILSLYDDLRDYYREICTEVN